MSQSEEVRTDESNVVDKKLRLDNDAVSSCTAMETGRNVDDTELSGELVNSDAVSSCTAMETGRNVDDTELSGKLVNSDVTASSEAASEDGKGIEPSEWTSGSDHIEQTVNDGTDEDALERLRSGQTHDAQEEYYDNYDDYWKAQTAAYNKAKEKYEFFWHSDSIYSQWHDSGFLVDGRWFSCAEQYMMYGKAVTFKDFKTARKILYSKDPRKMKALGREVQNFKPFKWQCYCLYIVKEGNMAKFSQNEGLKEAILATYPKVLVEASPKDNIWGIGCAEEDPRAWNEDTWDGTNYLGYVLTEVRDELKGVPEGQRVNYIHKLLRGANMSDEMIQEFHPDDWKPTAEEEREINGEHRGEKRKESQENYSNNQHGRGGQHTGPRDNTRDGARRNDHGHGETQRHRSGPQGGEERNNSASDSNWRSGPRKEAGRDKWESGKGKYYQDKQHRDVDYSERDQYEYFWGQKNFYSQFYSTEFEVDNEWFNCAEQYMMYMKARLFEDHEIAREILRTDDPIKIKGLGRKVRNFNDDIWQKESLRLVKKGNIAKFSQNERLKRVIIKTHPKILVEASPHDKIWGIGLDKDDERAWRRATWQGTNFLGFILTEVRDEIMARDKLIEEKDRKVFLPDLQKQYAGALKNRMSGRDKAGGWEKYNQGAQTGQNRGAASNENLRSPEYLQSNQSANNEYQSNKRNNMETNGQLTKDSNDEVVSHPKIPGLIYADQKPAKPKKRKGKGKQNESRQQLTQRDWFDEEFQVPDVMTASEQRTEDNTSLEPKTEENVKPTTENKNNTTPMEESKTTAAKEKKITSQKKDESDGWEKVKDKKSKRQGSPEKGEAQKSKDGPNANPQKSSQAVGKANAESRGTEDASKPESVPEIKADEAGSNSSQTQDKQEKEKVMNSEGLSKRQMKNLKRKEKKKK